MRVNCLAYTVPSYSTYVYAYILITNQYSIEDIKADGRPIVFWGDFEEVWGGYSALKEVGLEIYAYCDVLQPESISKKYATVKNYKEVLRNANKYYHIIHYPKDRFKQKQTVKMLLYAGVRELGIIEKGWTKDLKEKFSAVIYQSINEVWNDIDFIGHWQEYENIRRTALPGMGYFDYPFMWIYKLYKNRTNIKCLEVGAGNGVMSFSLKKIMDMDITWLDLPIECPEDMWIENRAKTMETLQKKYDIKMIYGAIELDDFSDYNNTFDVIVLTQVMEHFIYNPVNAFKKLRNLLKNDGMVFVSVPENIKHYNVSHYSEMPYPNELTQEERSERCRINEYWHFHEYSEEEAVEVFEESGLACMMHVLTSEIHHFALRKM